MENYNKTLPKVSILVPMYNSEAYLVEALDSCINQTYENIEIIIVDDGSTDESLRIAETIKDVRVHVYSQSNSGACVARNIAFEKSHGDYIMYFDADDLINKSYVSSLVKCLRDANDLSIATGEWDRFRTDLSEASFPKLSVYKDYDNAFNLLLDMWTTGEMLTCSSYLVPRKLVEIAGGWDASVLKNQDGEFFSRVLMAADKVYHTANAKFYYRTGEYLSVSKASSKAKVASMLDTFISYRKNALAIEDSERVRKALAVNFTLFMYIHGNQFPDLMKIAQSEVKNLGVGYQMNTQPRRVQRLCKVIGFSFFMYLRKKFLHR